MKQAAALFAALLLNGCSSDDNSDYRAYFQLARQSLHSAIRDGAVTPQEVATVPHASMGVRVDGSSEIMLALASDMGGDLLWTSKVHIVIMTHDGRITRTVGLEHDVGSIAPQVGKTIPAPAQALKQSYVSIRNADFPDIGAYAMVMVCSSASAGPQRISILGNSIATMRVDEHCRSVSYNWEFTDSYWVDPQSGFVWRAQQHVHPDGEVLTTEILRRLD